MKVPFTSTPCHPPWPARLAAGLALLVAMAALTATASPASAAVAPVDLATAGNFAVLAGSSVTNTGVSHLTGDLGAGSTVTGVSPAMVTGAEHIGDPAEAQAEADLATAYNDAAGRTPALTVAGDVGGQTLTPGVYNSASSLAVNGTLTLDAQGDPSAVFIFQIGSSLTTGSGSSVTLTGGAQAANIFWQVGGDATLGMNSTFAGAILAQAAITLTTSATIDGLVLARNGAVTLDTNTVTDDDGPALAITSTAASGSTSPGDTVEFTVTIADTGQTPYADAALTDSLTGVLDDASYNDAAAASAGTVSFTTPDLSWTGDLAVGDTVTITYSVTVHDPDTGDMSLASTVTSAEAGSNCPSGSSDSRCSATVAVADDTLSITVPASADLGSAAPGGTVSAGLGDVQVTDNRAGLAADWTATVSSSDLTTGGGTAPETIPAADALYLISGFTATAGSATFTPAPSTTLSASAQAVVTATNVQGDNSVSWDPVMQVSVPSGAIAGPYSATITYSVS